MYSMYLNMFEPEYIIVDIDILKRKKKVYKYAIK